MHFIRGLAFLVPLIAAQDFSWLNTELSQIISYESLHYTECNSYPKICPPVTSSCALTLCENCPKYYRTCCLSATDAASCFQSIHNHAVGTAVASSTVGGGNDNVPTTTAAAGGGMTTDEIGTKTTAKPSILATDEGGSVTPVLTIPTTTQGAQTTIATSTKTGGVGQDQVKIVMVVTFSAMALFMA